VLRILAYQFRAELRDTRGCFPQRQRNTSGICAADAGILAAALPVIGMPQFVKQLEKGAPLAQRAVADYL